MTTLGGAVKPIPGADGIPRWRQSVPAAPKIGGANAEPPAANPRTGLGTREFPRHSRHQRALCLLLRYAHRDHRCGSSARMVHRTISSSTVPYAALGAPIQHSWWSRWVKPPLNSFLYPGRRARQRFHRVNTTASSIPFRPFAWSPFRAPASMGYRDGEHHKTALRAGSTLGARPASNWEQALHPGIPKIPPNSVNRPSGTLQPCRVVFWAQRYGNAINIYEDTQFGGTQ